MTSGYSALDCGLPVVASVREHNIRHIWPYYTCILVIEDVGYGIPHKIVDFVSCNIEQLLKVIAKHELCIFVQNEPSKSVIPTVSSSVHVAVELHSLILWKLSQRYRCA